MIEWKPLKIAFAGVDIPEDIASLTKEYEFSFERIHTANSDLKRDLQRINPDIVIADPKHISNIYANVPQDNRPSIFVAVPESVREFPTVFDAGVADDLLLLPMRRLEFLSRMRWHGYLNALRSVEGLNSSVTRLVQKLEEDIVHAQKIQRRLIKDRFPPMAGITVKSKYWCGLRGGGDYFDIFEFSDKNYIGFLLSDVSSYRLSSAFISAMMQLPSKLEANEIKDPLATVQKIFGLLRDQMDDKENFSMFYGVLDRRSFVMKYVAFGKVFVNLQTASGGYNWLSRAEGEPLCLKTAHLLAPESVRDIAFEPEDRLYIISDGFEEGLESPLPKFLEHIENRDPQAVINEFAFALRTKQDPDGSESDEGDFPMPPQDCSVLLVDVAKNILRLAR